MSFEEDQIRRVLAAGPARGDRVFRAKFSGAVDTKTLNVTADQLARIAAILADVIEARHLSHEHIGAKITIEVPRWRPEPITGILRWFTHTSDGVLVAIEENEDDGAVELDQALDATIKIHPDDESGE